MSGPPTRKRTFSASSNGGEFNRMQMNTYNEVAPVEYPKMMIMPLGAGNEVGRSCIMLKYQGRTVMLDCGIHPGYSGQFSLPHFETIADPSEIDLLLITHFHIDHAASLPYFTEKIKGFKGRIFMTHPTKAVMRMLLNDYIRLANIAGDGDDDEMLYNEVDLKSCIDKIELIDYHQVVEHKGIKFTCYNAGHVLGAAMFMIDIAGVNVLYTGDYSLEDDRHLMKAEIPSKSPDVLIVESTYGVQKHDPRETREHRFTSTVDEIVRRGGKCLVPVFALGRAQELLLILDEYWQSHKTLQNIPIYYASKLATKALRVYQTYINMMNDHIRRQMDISNPFRFDFIRNLDHIRNFDDSGPSVVMASPGMLQSGVSRELFDKWCIDKKNGVIIAGYSVEGTLAKKILSAPKEITGQDGKVRPLNCLVEYISFSAHVDYNQNKEFISAVAPQYIILVHGEAENMSRLKDKLDSEFKVSLPDIERPQIFTPMNTQEVKIPFTRQKVAKSIGQLAEKKPRNGDVVHGVFVSKNFADRIVDPEDLPTYTKLRVTPIKQRISFPFQPKASILRKFLDELFYDHIEEELVKDIDDEEEGIHIYKYSIWNGVVVVLLNVKNGEVILEWDASPVNDMIADSIIAVAMEAQSSPESLRLSSLPCRHHQQKDETPEVNISAEEASQQKKLKMLEAVKSTFMTVFGDNCVKLDSEKLTISIKNDLLEDGTMEIGMKTDVSDINSIAFYIENCSNVHMANSAQRVLDNVASALASVRP